MPYLLTSTSAHNKTMSLLKPTKKEKKERAQMWIDALMVNKKKCRHTMFNKTGGNCCLMVATKVAQSQGVDEIVAYGDELPGPQVCSFFGWSGNRVDEPNPKLKVPSLNLLTPYMSSSTLNDGGKGIKPKGLTHKQIAECVTATFINPKHKFTFILKTQ